MKYFKINHDLPADPKIALIAKRTGLRRSDILALWVVLLDFASQNHIRGSLENIDFEDIAFNLEMDMADAERAFEAFKQKRMITPALTIAQWKKNQNLSTDRVRAWRRRQKLSKENDLDDDVMTAQRRARLSGKRRNNIQFNLEGDTP